MTRNLAPSKPLLEGCLAASWSDGAKEYHGTAYFPLVTSGGREGIGRTYKWIDDGEEMRNSAREALRVEDL